MIYLQNDFTFIQKRKKKIVFIVIYLMISFTQAFYGMDDLFYMKLMDEIINETTHTDLTKKF